MTEVIADAMPVDGPQMPGCTLQSVQGDRKVKRIIITDVDGRTPLGAIGYVEEIIRGLFHCRIIGMEDWYDIQFSTNVDAMSWVYDAFTATKTARVIAKCMREYERGLICPWERDQEITLQLALLGNR